MSVITLSGAGGVVRADLARPMDLSIPLRFAGAQPRAFEAPAARAETFRSGSFVGDVALGGSCNCAQYRLIPHCNGTHTECVGHLTREPVSIRETLRPGLVPALLLSVPAAAADGCEEDSAPRPQPRDTLITARAIAAAWELWPWSGVAVLALALRTLPNDVDKLARRYAAATPPPYLTRQAARLLVERGIKHLLLDVPSADRLEDGGLLTAHRLFFGLPPGRADATAATRPDATVTELIYAADEIADGCYLLDLQIAPFAADAAPSRPILYPVIDATNADAPTRPGSAS